MSTQVILFGRLADIAGSPVFIEGAADTDSLIEKLHKAYPVLTGSTYLIAVDKDIVHSNTLLNENSIVALMPPFSGG